MTKLRAAVKKNLEKIIAEKKSLGVMVSGGLDSSLLLYYVLTEHPGPVRVFTVPKRDNAMVHAKRMTNFICKILSLQNIEPQMVGNADFHHSEQVLGGLNQIF